MYENWFRNFSKQKIQKQSKVSYQRGTFGRNERVYAHLFMMSKDIYLFLFAVHHLHFNHWAETTPDEILSKKWAVIIRKLHWFMLTYTYICKNGISESNLCKQYDYKMLPSVILGTFYISESMYLQGRPHIVKTSYSMIWLLLQWKTVNCQIWR